VCARSGTKQSPYLIRNLTSKWKRGTASLLYIWATWEVFKKLESARCLLRRLKNTHFSAFWNESPRTKNLNNPSKVTLNLRLLATISFVKNIFFLAGEGSQHCRIGVCFDNECHHWDCHYNTLAHYRPAMPFGNRKKNILENLFSSVLSQFKYHPSGNLKFNDVGIFQSLKLRILEGKNPSNFS